MASKRRPINMKTPSPKLNFRPSTSDNNVRAESKGTRPTSTPTSIGETIVMMMLYVCKKSIFFDVNLKVALYLASLFLVSLIADFIPFPKSYFARSDNIFNQYFVKIGWFWTLLLSTPFLLLTSYTYCCGNRNKVLKNHLTRIAVATLFWYIFTTLFNIIETNYGRCNMRNFDSKQVCLKNGHFWQGLDISGHAFILIYSSLILMEEARAINNWESLKEHIRNEDHARSIRQTELTSNPLRNLQDTEFQALKVSYEKFTPAIRGLFIGMTLLQILWDVMLFCTMLYYHIMIEKFLSGVFAILLWFFTYRFWYANPRVIPDLPGEGEFKYQKKEKQQVLQSLRRNNSIPTNGNQLPKFMGMPLYGLRTQSVDNPASTPRDIFTEATTSTTTTTSNNL